jgi:hypothetical protein
VTGIFQVNANTAGLRRRPVFKSAPSYAIFGLSGVTRDAAGAPLGGCTVSLFTTGTEAWIADTISDGSGFFSFKGIGVGSVFITAYLDGSPEVAGVTIHDLSPIVVG